MREQRPYRNVLALGLPLVLAASWPTTSFAEENTPGEPSASAFERFATRDYLLGDWGGLRTQLKEKGVDFEFVYFGAVPSNVGGGIKQGSVYEGAFMMLLDLDS